MVSKGAGCPERHKIPRIFLDSLLSIAEKLIYFFGHAGLG